MTQEQFKKNLILLAAYSKLVHLQCEILCTEPTLRKDARRKIKGVSERAKLDFGTICNVGSIDKVNIIDMAGAIDDIVRPGVIDTEE